MVIDTSAIVALLGMEKEAARIAHALEADVHRLISAATLLESSIVIEARYGEGGGREFDLLVAKAGFLVREVDAEQAELARKAWRRFGKGRHAAGLNYGDCFSYALAKFSGEPLLFKGDDFGKTDIAIVAY